MLCCVLHRLSPLSMCAPSVAHQFLQQAQRLSLLDCTTLQSTMASAHLQVCCCSCWTLPLRSQGCAAKSFDSFCLMAFMTDKQDAWTLHTASSICQDCACSLIWATRAGKMVFVYSCVLYRWCWSSICMQYHPCLIRRHACSRCLVAPVSTVLQWGILTRLIVKGSPMLEVHGHSICTQA